MQGKYWVSNQKSEKLQSPCLFIFDSSAAGVEEPALSMFTGAVLDAISRVDPGGTLSVELRGGVSLVSNFTTVVTAVSSSQNKSSHTQTHDMSLFRLLLWDMAQSLSEGSRALELLSILNVLRTGCEECLTLSDIPEYMREKCDAYLRETPGYVGVCLLDAGNPIQRKSFYDGLMHLAIISNGTIFQQRTIEGDEDWELNGARNFKPNGLKWTDCSFGYVDKSFRLEKAVLSDRGMLSLNRLNRKRQTTVEGRVFRAIVDSSWSDRSGQYYEFASVEAGLDILQAVLPEGKFTDYLFNKDHDKGAARRNL